MPARAYGANMPRPAPSFPERPSAFEVSPQRVCLGPPAFGAHLAGAGYPTERTLYLRNGGAVQSCAGEHRLDGGRVIQVAESRLQRLQALHEWLHPFRRIERRKELDRVAQFLRLFAQFVPMDRI